VDANGDNLRMSHSRTQERAALGWVKFDQTETFERQVSRVADRRTRRREWFNDPAYPVRIDAAISEEITATADDVWEGKNFYTGGTNMFVGHSTYYNYALHAGVRFQTINIDQAETINSATLKLYMNSKTGSPSGFIYADDVDDAPAWSASNKPSGITKTTAKTAVAGAAPAGYKSHDVTAIVQEIVNRGAWAANNDIRFGILGSNTGNAYWLFEDYSAFGPEHSILDVNYGAASGQPAVKRMGGVPFAGNRGVW